MRRGGVFAEVTGWDALRTSSGLTFHRSGNRQPEELMIVGAMSRRSASRRAARQNARAGQGDDALGPVGAGEIRVGVDPASPGESLVRTQ